MPAKMAAKIILYYFLGVGNAFVVFLTNENIRVDTKIAGLSGVHAELCTFEEIPKWLPRWRRRISYSGFSDVYPSFFSICVVRKPNKIIAVTFHCYSAYGWGLKHTYATAQASKGIQYKPANTSTHRQTNPSQYRVQKH